MAIAFRMKKTDVVTSEVAKFHKACMESRLADVKASLDRGVSIEEKSGEYSISALLWASMYGKDECVRFLLSRGAAVNSTNKYGRTALVYASIHGHAKVVSALLAHGALIYTANRNGKTAFDWAKSTEIKDMLWKAMIYERRRAFLMFLAFSQFLIHQPRVDKMVMAIKLESCAHNKLSMGSVGSSCAEKVLATRDLHRQIMSFL